MADNYLERHREDYEKGKRLGFDVNKDYPRQILEISKSLMMKVYKNFKRHPLF